MTKPNVFIGSSAESINIAHTIQELLEYDAAATVWDQSFFTPSSTVLDDLVGKLSDFDFGIFVFSPEDLVKIREQQYTSVRDNVLFELGLFIGSLGKTRNFIILPKDQQDFRLPSDLAGVILITYDPDVLPMDTALGPACNKIRKAMQTQGVRVTSLQPGPGNNSEADNQTPPEADRSEIDNSAAFPSFYNDRVSLGQQEKKILSVILSYGQESNYAMASSQIKMLLRDQSEEDDDVDIATTKLTVRGFITPCRIKAYSITKKGWQWIAQDGSLLSGTEAGEEVNH